MEKVYTKQQFIDAIRKEYDNDPRITDELLFDGNRMTMQGYIFLETLYKKQAIKGLYGLSHGANFLDAIGYHCYLVFEFGNKADEKKGFDKVKLNTIQPIVQKVYAKLDKLVAENGGCYFVSDSVAGGRDGGDHPGNSWSDWHTGMVEKIVDIWVFSKDAAFIDFLENNEAKCKVLLENE